MNAYPGFVKKDEIQQFPLLKELQKLAIPLHRENDLAALLAYKIISNLENMEEDGGKALQTGWQAMRTPDISDMTASALTIVFKDTELNKYGSHFMASSPKTVTVVLEMYFYMLHHFGLAPESVLKKRERIDFVELGIVALLPDRNCLFQVLSVFRSSEQLIDEFSGIISQYLITEPNKLHQWWEILLQVNGEDIIRLSETLCAQRVDIEMIEDLLVFWIKRKGCWDGNCIKAFDEAVKRLKKKQDTGDRLFSTWIEMADEKDYYDIIRMIRDSDITKQTEENLFRRLDQKISYDVSFQRAKDVCPEMKEWGHQLGRSARCGYFYSFYTKFTRAMTLRDAISIGQEFARIGFPIERYFEESESFHKIAEWSAYLSNATAESMRLHFQMLDLFSFYDDKKAINRYADAYVKEVLASTKRNQLVDNLVSLCAVTCYRFQLNLDGRNWQNEQQRRQREIQRELMQNQVEVSLCAWISEHWQTNFQRQIEKLGENEKNSDSDRKYYGEVLEQLLSMVEKSEGRSRGRSTIDSTSARYKGRSEANVGKTTSTSSRANNEKKGSTLFEKIQDWLGKK